MIVNVQPKVGAGYRTEDAFYVEIVLSSGQVLTLRELFQFPGNPFDSSLLNVSVDNTLIVLPSGVNSVNLQEVVGMTP
jgi:hypothetical protein